jgi:hypothetical protein
MQLTLAAGIGPTVTLGSTGSYSTTVPGQNAYFYFAGTAGEDIGLGLTGLTLSPTSPTSVYMYLYGPTGTQLTWTQCYTANPGGGCNISKLNLPSTGTYSVMVQPGVQQTMSFGFTASQNVGGTLTLNTPMGVTLLPGQDTALTFTATANQSVSVTATSIVTTPASQTVTVTVYNSSGTSVGSSSGTTSVTVSLTSLPAGTYTIVAIPSNAASATLQITY